MGGMPGGMPGGAPSGAPGAPAGGGAPPNPIAALMALMGKGFNSNKSVGGDLDAKSLDQTMATVQKLSSMTMHSNPKAYQALLRALTALHSARQEIQQMASRGPSTGPPLTSSLLDLIAPSNSMAKPVGGMP